MKGLYNSKISFNGEYIVASACDCKSGCKVESSLIAIHNKNLCTFYMMDWEYIFQLNLGYK